MELACASSGICSWQELVAACANCSSGGHPVLLARHLLVLAVGPGWGRQAVSRWSSFPPGDFPIVLGLPGSVIFRLGPFLTRVLEMDNIAVITRAWWL